MGIWMNVIWTKVRFFDFVAVITKRKRARHDWRNIEFCTYFQRIISHTSTRFYCRIYIQCYPPMMWCTHNRKIFGTGWTWCMRASAMRSTSRWKRSLAAKLRNIQIKNGSFALILMLGPRNATINALTLNQILRCLFLVPNKVVDSWWQHDIMHRHLRIVLVRRYLCV